MTKPVLLSDYNPQWPNMFEQFAHRIRTIVGDDLSAIFHVGSTSVPGLCAKPVIDILPTVRDLTLLEKFKSDFERAGFEWRGEYGIPGRRYIVGKEGSIAANVGCHIHFFASSNFEVNKHVLFRDYLRTNEVAKQEYAALKRNMATTYPNDRDAYQKSKELLIEILITKAWQQTIIYREPIQVNVFGVSQSSIGAKFLMLKRIEQRGGFWQSVTGAPEVRESLKSAAKREFFEETRIQLNEVKDLAFSYSFPLDPRLWSAVYRPEVIRIDEHVYWSELSEAQIPKLSNEHTAYEWATYEKCIELLKWQSNKDALKILSETLNHVSV